MTIENGEVIEAAELNSAFTESLSLLATDNRRLPTNVWLNINYEYLNNTHTAKTWQRRIIIPDDMRLTEVAVIAYIPNTYTGYVELSGGGLYAPIIWNNMVCNGSWQKFTRYYQTTEPEQILLKGATLTAIAKTNATSNYPRLQILIGGLNVTRRF